MDEILKELEGCPEKLVDAVKVFVGKQLKHYGSVELLEKYDFPSVCSLTFLTRFKTGNIEGLTTIAYGKENNHISTDNISPQTLKSFMKYVGVTKCKEKYLLD